eukprot:INCI13930.3.p1 GENE.INCI13930.3~~INCI13930.3.p1  ORF type:complete len:855 (-),score=139.31 INCI13930.3:57-2411(-)
MDVARRELQQLAEEVCKAHTAPLAHFAIPDYRRDCNYHLVFELSDNKEQAVDKPVRQVRHQAEAAVVSTSASESDDKSGVKATGTLEAFCSSSSPRGGENDTRQELSDLDIALAVKFHFNDLSQSAETMAASMRDDRLHFQADPADHLLQKKDLVDHNRRIVSSHNRRLMSLLDETLAKAATSSSDEEDEDGEEGSWEEESEEEQPAEFTKQAGQAHAKAESQAVPVTAPHRAPRKIQDKKPKLKTPRHLRGIPLAEYIDPDGHDSVAWKCGLGSIFENNIEIISRKQSHCHSCNACRTITVSPCTRGLKHRFCDVHLHLFWGVTVHDVMQEPRLLTSCPVCDETCTCSPVCSKDSDGPQPRFEVPNELRANTGPGKPWAPHTSRVHFPERARRRANQRIKCTTPIGTRRCGADLHAEVAEHLAIVHGHTTYAALEATNGGAKPARTSPPYGISQKPKPPKTPAASILPPLVYPVSAELATTTPSATEAVGQCTEIKVNVNAKTKTKNKKTTKTKTKTKNKVKTKVNAKAKVNAKTKTKTKRKKKASEIELAGQPARAGRGRPKKRRAESQDEQSRRDDVKRLRPTVEFDSAKPETYVYDSNMGYCGKCKEAGDLLCCDTCPNAYHQKCIGITSIPDGDWFCNWCVATKSPDWASAPKQEHLKATEGASVPKRSSDPQSLELDRLKLVERILQRLCTHDYADIFTEPLPVHEIPGYTDIVSHPMDLGTVTQRIKRGYYKTAAGAIADTKLCFDNCLKYNHEGVALWHLAKALKKSFLNMLHHCI